MHIELRKKYEAMSTEQLYLARDRVEFTWRGDEDAIRSVLQERHAASIALEEAVLTSR